MNTTPISGTLAEERSLAQIKMILTKALKDEACTIYLFGSRATGTATTTSDFDLAVLANSDISVKLSLAREMLEQSNIPFKVDLIELKRTSTAFSHRVQSEGVVLWKN